MTSLVASTAAAQTGNTGITTSGINTTGANLIVMYAAAAGVPPATVSDSYSNTWTPLTSYDGPNVQAQFYYCVNPTVGTGHTFSVPHQYGAVSVLAFSGTFAVPGANDIDVGATQTTQPGSATPEQESELIITGYAAYTAAGTPTVDSGFAIPSTAYANASQGVASAWQVQSSASATAVNPTWAWGGGITDQTPAMCSFQTKVWVRATEPLISQTVSWEQNGTSGGGVVQEPSIIVDTANSLLRCFYGGGYGAPQEATGYMTCPTSSDPTVTSNWTKYASNPVIGVPFGSPTVLAVGSTLYAYGYGDATETTSDLQVCSSTNNGNTWTSPTTVVSASLAGWIAGWAGSFIWKEGSTWYMLLEGWHSSESCWAINLLSSTSSTPDSGWAMVGSGPLTSLQVGGSGQDYGGPWLGNSGGLIGGKYHLWYHTPSNIVHATSTDKVNWTQTKTLGLTHTGGTYEADQAADASIFEFGGKTYMLFSGVNNGGPQHGYINIASYNGTLANFVGSFGNAQSVTLLTQQGQQAVNT